MLCFVWPQISSISVLEKFIENTSIIQWIIFCWSFWDFEGRDRQRGGKKKYWQKYPFSLFSLIEAIFDFDILHARQKMKAVSFSFFLFFTLLLFFCSSLPTSIFVAKKLLTKQFLLSCWQEPVSAETTLSSDKTETILFLCRHSRTPFHSLPSLKVTQTNNNSLHENYSLWNHFLFLSPGETNKGFNWLVGEGS